MPVAAGRRRRGKPWQRLELSVVLLTASVILLILGLIGGHLVANRNDMLRRAGQSATNLASAFEEHLAVSIGLLNDTLLALRTQPFIRSSDSLREGLRVRPGLNDIALQVAVADRTGRIYASNFDLGQPISIADREHFRHFSESDADDLFISKPLLGRVTHRWTIQFVRRLTDANGQFDGIIVISLEPAYLIHFYHTIDTGPSGLVTLIGLDGVVRARSTRGDSSFGQEVTRSPLVQAAIAQQQGLFDSVSPVDGVERLLGFKHVRGYPLFVAVGFAYDDILADYHKELWLWLAMAAAGVVFVSVAGWLTLRQIRARQAFEESVANHRRRLEALVAERTHSLSEEVERRTQSEQALQESLDALKAAQQEALQASRLASVGQLAAGIAHEINTPVQYVGDNLRFIGNCMDKLIAAVDAGQELVLGAPGAAARFDASVKAAKLSFLRSELPSAVEESLDGVGQIARIVLSMKEFSHPGSSAKVMTDINRALESTLTVSHNVWKLVATVEKRFDPSLPQTLCHAGELNQVFLNLIVNAVDAIEGSGKPLPGHITVETAQENGMVVIRVSDSGTGVPDSIREQIFDLFFTTKEVGKGTGQGLAISRDVVVTKHGGSVEVGGEAGVGAVFTVRIPILEEEPADVEVDGE